MTGEQGRPEDQRWTWSPGVHGVELDGETVLYDRRRRRLHLLNPSATVIWAALDGSLTGEQLVSELSQAFGVRFQTMHDHVTEVLATLREEGLIRAAGHLGTRGCGGGTR